MKWTKNPKWTWRNDAKYWLYHMPLEVIKALITEDKYDLGWRGRIAFAKGIADMKCGRFYTVEID